MCNCCMAWLNWAEYRLTLTLPCRFKALFSRRAEAVGHGGALREPLTRGVPAAEGEAGSEKMAGESGEKRLPPQQRGAAHPPAEVGPGDALQAEREAAPQRRPNPSPHTQALALCCCLAHRGGGGGAGRAHARGRSFPTPPPSLSPPLPLHPGTTALAWRAAAQLFFPRQSEIKARAPRGNIVPPVRSPSPPHWRRGGGGRWHGAGRGGAGAVGWGGVGGSGRGRRGRGPPSLAESE